MRRFHPPVILLLAVLAGLSAGAATAADSDPVVIGSTNFPEQLILANIYADVLAADDIDVKKRLNLGSREVVFPALESGELDLLPEYTGSALEYLTEGQSKAHKSEAVLKALRNKLPDDLVALTASSAQDRDALVVTPETAEKYDLKTLSDLQPVAGKLTMGGPPEDKTRWVGLPGLKKVYGIEFGAFRSLDAGGPLTTAALQDGVIDVARMFTTQGIIQARDWVVLKDDKDLVAAQNLLPIARKDALTPTVRKRLKAVSKTLTTKQLRKMNRQASENNLGPAAIASRWVDKHHLAGD